MVRFLRILTSATFTETPQQESFNICDCIDNRPRLFKQIAIIISVCDLNLWFDEFLVILLGLTTCLRHLCKKKTTRNSKLGPFRNCVIFASYDVTKADNWTYCVSFSFCVLKLNAIRANLGPERPENPSVKPQ